MKLSARQLNRATLQRQMLLRREQVEVLDEAVRRIVAMQAQHPASPYIALWNRVAGFAAAELDAAFNSHRVVKATLMRVTLHAVHAEDYPTMHAAMQPTLRAARLNDRRFTVSGLTPAEAEALLPHVKRYTRTPRSNSDMEAWAEKRHAGAGGPVWWGLRQVAPLWHAPGDTAWSFGQRPAFTAARTRRPGDPETSLPALVRRYLEGFGPASVADIGQFTMLHRPRIRAAVEKLGDQLERFEGPAGEELLDVAGGSRPDGDEAAPPRLMAMWDSILLAYADRSRVLPEAYRKAVIRNNGDVLPALLVDGHVAGVWRPAEGGVECTAFHPLSKRDWDGLATEAAALMAFLAGREPTVYSRYGRWWNDLPAAEVRLLGA